MPSRSKAQRRKMAILFKKGEITKTQWEHFKKVVPKKTAVHKKDNRRKR